MLFTAENIEILTNFLVCKFCGNRQKLRGNCAFTQNSHARKLGEITIIFAMFFETFLNMLNAAGLHLIRNEFWHRFLF